MHVNVFIYHFFNLKKIKKFQTKMDQNLNQLLISLQKELIQKTQNE